MEEGEGVGGDKDSLVNEILVECTMQDRRWGAKRSHSNLEWRIIFGEEIGEVDMALVKGHWADGPMLRASYGRLARRELIHALAVGLQWLEAMDRGEGSDEQ